MKLSLLLTLLAGALAAVLLAGIGGLVAQGGAPAAGPDSTVQALRAQGIPADPAPSVYDVCRLPLAGRLPVCPIDQSAAAAAARKAGGTVRAVELVSLRLRAGGRMLAWAVTVRRVFAIAAMCPLPAAGVTRPLCPAPAASTVILLVDARSGGRLDCSALQLGGPAAPRPDGPFVECAPRVVVPLAGRSDQAP